MNRVEITGRISFIRKDTKHIQISVAVQNYNSRKSEVITDFLQCVAFDNTAQFISNNFKVGDWIEGLGRIKPNSYTAKDGTKHYTQDIILQEVSFVGYKRQDSLTPEISEMGDFREIDNQEIKELPWE